MHRAGRTLSKDGAQTPLAVYTMVPSHRRYGGESAALAALDGLRSDFQTLLLAPPGGAHARAAQLGIESAVFRNRVEFLVAMARLLMRERRIGVMTTAMEHSLIIGVLGLVLRPRLAHLQLGHGGPNRRRTGASGG